MLLVLFNLGNDKYAIDSSQVLKIIPMVTLKPISTSLSPIVGVFNYGGKLIPVIDLGELIQGNPCHRWLSTRIILVQPAVEEQNLPILGLIAEQVTDTIQKKEENFTSSDFQNINSLYLGEMIHDEQGMIQYLRLEHLLGELQRKRLIPKALNQ